MTATLEPKVRAATGLAKLDPADVLGLRRAAAELVVASAVYARMGQWLFAENLARDATQMWTYAWQGLEGHLDIAKARAWLQTVTWKREPLDAAGKQVYAAYGKALSHFGNGNDGGDCGVR